MDLQINSLYLGHFGTGPLCLPGPTLCLRATPRFMMWCHIRDFMRWTHIPIGIGERQSIDGGSIRRCCSRRSEHFSDLPPKFCDILMLPPGQRPKAVISCSIFRFPSLRLSRRWATLRVGREDVWSLPGRLSQCSAYKKNVTFCLFVVLDAHSFWHNWGQNMTSITFFHQDKVFFARKVEHEISLIFNGT